MIWLFSKIFGKSSDLDNLDHLNAIDMKEASKRAGADSLIVFCPLNSDKDAEKINAELMQGNIVIMEIGKASGASDFAQLLDKVKDVTYRIDGDIARISSDRVIASPRKVKILRKKIVAAGESSDI